MPRVSYHKIVEGLVNFLAGNGNDVSLRSGYGLWGLSSADGSRDISVLYTAKELVIFLRGFQAAQHEQWRKNRDAKYL